MGKGRPGKPQRMAWAHRADVTLLPLVVIDGAEKVEPGPATVAACQVAVPFWAQ
jgi:hypothetical protein